MKNRIKSFIFIIGAVIVSGCASKSLQTKSLQKAQWETKALIRDLKADKAQSLTIDILAVRSEKARFEISALLGYPVGTLVMTPSQFALAIYPQKKFYFGRNSETAIEGLLKISLHPMNLSNIAFDEPVRGSGWTCSKDVQGMISECNNKARNLAVQWQNRSVDGAKTVVISGPQFEMRWVFNAPQTDVQFKPETFTLQQPAGFKAIQIN